MQAHISQGAWGRQLFLESESSVPDMPVGWFVQPAIRSQTVSIELSRDVLPRRMLVWENSMVFPELFLADDTVKTSIFLFDGAGTLN